MTIPSRLKLALALVTGLLVLSAFKGFAIEKDFSLSQILRDAQEAKSITIAGILVCDNEAQRDENSCVMRLKEPNSGKSFMLYNAQAAVKLFMSGKDNVVITGARNGNAIEVYSARAL